MNARTTEQIYEVPPPRQLRCAKTQIICVLAHLNCLGRGTKAKFSV